MTDAMIDDLLDELVPKVDWLPDWPAVLLRARQARRRRVAIAVAIAALVLVPTALAVGADVLDWFHGKPATPAVKQEFVRFDAMTAAMSARAAQYGFHQKAPIAIASKAHGIIALRAPGATIYLWAAPRRGGGACSLTQVKLAAGGMFSTGGCDEHWPPQDLLSYGQLGAHDFAAGDIVSGRAFHATSVLVHLSDGSSARFPVVEDFFIGVIPKHTHPLEVDSYDAGGRRVALMTYLRGTATLDRAERKALGRVSRSGTPLHLPPRDPRTTALRARGFEPVADVLAIRDGRRYLRLRKPNGSACYAAGLVARSWPIGMRLCGTAAAAYAGASYFPSALAPILDFSKRGLTADGRRGHYTRVGGIAADGVFRVVIKDSEGRGLRWLRVRNNVYDSGSAPLPDAAVQLAAEDAKGRQVARLPR